MTTITDALRAARACIQQDRTSLADTCMRHDNTMDPDAAAGVAEYDAVLQQIDSALAGMSNHITDEQIAQAVARGWCHPSNSGKEMDADLARAISDEVRAVLALAAPAPAVPSIDYMALIDAARVRHKYAQGTRACVAFKHGAEWFREQALTAAPTQPAQPAPAEGGEVVAWRTFDGEGGYDYRDFEGNENYAAEWERLNPRHNGWVEPLYTSPPASQEPAPAVQAVPEVAPANDMTRKWCWWIGDDETFHVADTEDEAHGEARCRIDDDCMPGYQREYSVARVQHPIDALGMDWLAEHAAETIEENACCWCDDNTGAEEPSITLAAEDRKVLGTMVAAFLRENVSVHWWAADQKTITTHTYVAGSNDADAARAAEKGGA